MARTSTLALALTNVTTPYGLQIASKGYVRAALDNKAIAKGINVVAGHVAYKAVAEAHGYEHTCVYSLLR